MCCSHHPDRFPLSSCEIHYLYLVNVMFEMQSLKAVAPTYLYDIAFRFWVVDALGPTFECLCPILNNLARLIRKMSVALIEFTLHSNSVFGSLVSRLPRGNTRSLFSEWKLGLICSWRFVSGLFRLISGAPLYFITR